MLPCLPFACLKTAGTTVLRPMALKLVSKLQVGFDQSTKPSINQWNAKFDLPPLLLLLGSNRAVAINLN
ncbi:unnamed protein product [Hydatigera taeniaeformis]|uniref:Secreted protein n=1 Tax=Hydatigena taeniaeformis TaxID=6205 RepID=A0A0R3X2R8_HYDTA|nr:unnamed protein product [Hydatigera taeniaeformis]